MLPSIGQKTENSFDVFTEKFLQVKELAFKEFLMSKDADNIDN